MKYFFVFFAFFFAFTYGQVCGPAQCYSGCTDSRPIVDVVFLIDISGSMETPIVGVRSGLTQFATNLQSQNINPSYTIILFGGNPQLALQQTTNFATFKNTINGISDNGGGQEAGLETLRIAMGVATYNPFTVNYRSGSTIVFVMVTNEDSDPAMYSPNMYGTDKVHDGSCTYRNPKSGSQTSTTIIPASEWDVYQQGEIDNTAQNLISRNIALYMFVSGSLSLSTNQYVTFGVQCNTYYQYGNPDIQSQNADFTNFNAALTLAAIPSKSLQAYLLGAGKTCRVFEVQSASNTNIITNFFSQISGDLSKCDKCLSYPCSASNTCLAPVNICGCDGVPNSGKTYDPNGVCCLPSARDCAGSCNGLSLYDPCGVCSVKGVKSSYCSQDCSIYYINTKPPTGVPYIVTLQDPVGYYITNPSLNIYKSMVAVQNYYTSTGVFLNLYTCTFDSAKYAATYGVTASNAATDFWTSVAANSPKTATCVAGTRKRTGDPDHDPCGQCVPFPDVPPYCTKDCSGNYRMTAAQMWFTDACNYCVAPGTDTNAHKDTCGICDGGNAAKNACGVCFGSTAKDACANFVCKNITCSKDCDGVSRTTPAKHVDECGNCIDNGPVRAPTCVQDCAKIWYNNNGPAPNHVDECGNCIPAATVRASTCVQDCHGTWGGNSTVDLCLQCVVNGIPPHPCLLDCAGAPNYYISGVQTPVHTVDDCGICNTLANQNKLKDKCGICTNQPGYNSTTDCTPDCKNIYSLTSSTNRAFVDACGDCWFANQTSLTNSLMDSCGQCWPSVTDPSWNNLRGAPDSFGVYCACGVLPKHCNGTITTCGDTCPPPTYCNGTTVVPGDCGHCPGDQKHKDDCGICCEPNAGYACNQDKDDCGICFGFNKSKDSNACHICNATACVVDCQGTPFGHAVLGCDGVCNSNASCVVCGDGVVNGTETCDNGAGKNGPGTDCSSDCQKVAGSDTGKIVGGVIGGIAAVVFLAAAGLLAFKYAQKAGLIGNAKKQVNMGAANDNPLYASQQKVSMNPLYDA